MINLDNCPIRWLSIGYERENLARPVQIDFSGWAETYGDGVMQLLFVRPGETTPYPILLDIEGTVATWTPDATDTAKVGDGQAQLVYTVDEVVAKNAVFGVHVDPSLGVSGDPPEPYTTWLEDLTELAADAQQAALDAGSAKTDAEAAATAAENAQAAIENMTANAFITNNSTGTPAVDVVKSTDPDDGHVNLSFRFRYLKGAKGDKGNQGDPGPTGATGATGAPGADGQDGVSPTVEVSPISGGHQVTVTDANNVNVFNVMDGNQGQKGDPGNAATIEIGSVSTLAPGSAATVQNVGNEHAAVFNFGIPKGEPGDVISVNEKTGAVVLDAGDLEYDDGETYDEDTVGDAISGVKSAINSAYSSTNPPPYPVTSVNTQTGNVSLDAGDIAFDDSETYSDDSVGAELTSIRTAMEELLPGYDFPNIFNSTTVTASKAIRLSDNTIVANANTSISDYIAVNPGDIISLNQNLGSSKYGHGFYNSSKAIQTSIANNADNMTFVIPSGIAYIRLTVYSATMGTLKVTRMSAATNYFRNEMPDEIVARANPYVRHAIKTEDASLDGFTHCAFPDVALFADKEIVAYRASMSHVTPTDPSNWGGIMLDCRTPDGSWTHLGLLDTTGYTINGEMRDPKLTVSRDGTQLFLSVFTTYREEEAPNTDVHDNYIFTLNENLQITSMASETKPGAVIWGNVLTTPDGYLLISEYASGHVYVKKSATTFTGSLSGMTFSTVKTFTSTGLTECCLGYWNDEKLVIIMRRATNNVRFCFTTNLEGDSGWVSDFAPTGTHVIHAPMLLPSYFGEYLPFVGAEYSSSSLRTPIFGLIKKTNDSIALLMNVNIDPSITRYSGYSGIADLGGDTFAVTYYMESAESTSTLNAQTALYYKYVNLRRLLPASAWLNV